MSSSELIEENDVFACTTMSIQKGTVDAPSWLDDPALAETVKPEVIAEWKARFENAVPERVERAKVRYALLENSLRKLSEGGARIALCADTGLLSQAPGFTGAPRARSDGAGGDATARGHSRGHPSRSGDSLGFATVGRWRRACVRTSSS